MKRPAAILLLVFFGFPCLAAPAEDLDQLRQEVQQSHAVLDELKMAREKVEKSAALSANALELLKAGRYHEAEQAIAEWEAADPQDSRLPALKQLVSKLKVEMNPAREADLWAEYLNKTLEELQPKKENFVHRDY